MSPDRPDALQNAQAAVARAIAESLAVREIWDRVAEACRAVVPFDGMGIIQFEDPATVRAVAIADAPTSRALENAVFPRAGFSPVFWPDADDFIVVIEDAERELDRAYPVDRLALEHGCRSALRVPLSRGRHRIGSVLLVSKEKAKYARRHGEALRVVAELISIALAHQQLATALAEETRRTAAERVRAAMLEERVQRLAREI